MKQNKANHACVNAMGGGGETYWADPAISTRLTTNCCDWSESTSNLMLSGSLVPLHTGVYEDEYTAFDMSV